MSTLNDTPMSERTHIGIFGRRNAGKSSLINAICGQELAIVSEVAGTTTDPVYKSMEILPLGPVVLIDTAGIDDGGELGKKRVRKATEVLRKIDIALIVVDSRVGISEHEKDLINHLDKPYILVYNKCDLLENSVQSVSAVPNSVTNFTFVSSTKGVNIKKLREKIALLTVKSDDKTPFVEDLVDSGDIILLVMPQGAAAPKSRLILPEQQAVRAIIDKDGICVSIKDPWQIPDCLKSLSAKPKMVIVDSQIYEEAKDLVPDDILLTSFSILMARYRGTLFPAAEGAKAIENLQAGDFVLISEGCTHHRQCDDIGTVKLPAWLQKYTGRQLNFEYTAGRDFKSEFGKYKLIIHCGGCMLNDMEMQFRYAEALRAGVPITNYGIAIAYMNGILERAMRPFR